MRLCSRPDCERPHHARGLCGLHYDRARADGDMPEIPGQSRLIQDRLAELAAESAPDDCWIWKWRVDPCGYGRSGHRSAHRVAFELFVGPIPGGFHVDHLCRNRACVNPSHLEAVTPQENYRRSAPYREIRNAAGIRVCKQGHEYNAANRRQSGGRSFCRPCNRDAVARRTARLREEQAAA